MRTGRNRSRPLWCIVLAALLCGQSAALAQTKDEATDEDAAEEPPSDEETRQQEAKETFKAGRALMKEEKWNLALAEFQRSRELYPTRGNTQNAAVCLRELGRSAEALEMFELLMRDFDKLTDADRKQVAKEIGELRQVVGTIDVIILEPDAEVVVDGRPRGRTPLSSPLRANAGTHYVRVHKSGFVTFEQQVDVVAKQTTTIEHTMERLQRSGRITVVAPDSPGVEVLLDGVVVGVTPWEGDVAVGSHTVTLRGEGNVGSAPVAVDVTDEKPTTLRVEVVPLDSELRVQPQPLNAAVAIDGVDVGRGIWEGRLPSGDHVIEIAAEGFLAVKREVSLDAEGREVLSIELERDPDSALWADRTPSRLVLDVGLGAILSPASGGDVADGCEGSCSAGLGVGGTATLRGGYRFGMGIGLTLDAGFAMLKQSYEDRAAALTPRGLAANQGTLDDDLSLLGFLAGGSISYQVGKEFPFLIRAGGGVLLGTLKDERRGSFTTNLEPVEYEVAPPAESTSATYAYANPELRIGYRFGEHVIVSAGVSGLFLFALSQPEWTDETTLLAGQCDGASASACEGEATFGSETLLGSTIVTISPGLAASFEF